MAEPSDLAVLVPSIKVVALRGYFSLRRAAAGLNELLFSSEGTKQQTVSGTGSPPSMDPFLVMLGSLICTMIGLIFMEVRRIRKRLEQRAAEPAAKPTASA